MLNATEEMLQIITEETQTLLMYYLSEPIFFNLQYSVAENNILIGQRKLFWRMLELETRVRYWTDGSTS